MQGLRTWYIGREEERNEGRNIGRTRRKEGKEEGRRREKERRRRKEEGGGRKREEIKGREAIKRL